MKFLKKIKDERLILQNLKNIRIAFIVQSLGIIGILIYEGITKGFRAATGNPLWLVLLLTNTVLIGLGLRISIAMDEETSIKKQGPYYRIVIITALVGIIVGLLIKFGSKGTDTSIAIAMGVIIFVSLLISYSILYYLRKRWSEDDDL